VVARVRLLPREQWPVLIPDHHPRFITWEAYEANTARLRANWRPPRGEGGGPAREGRALLQVLLRCGRCGRIMQVGYSGPAGKSPRYLCARAKQLYADERTYESIGGIRLEQAILAELFAVLEPASLEATAKAPGRGRRALPAAAGRLRAGRRARARRSRRRPGAAVLERCPQSWRMLRRAGGRFPRSSTRAPYPRTG
jgi:hypothetical protein